jgi:hypothetical protein
MSTPNAHDASSLPEYSGEDGKLDMAAEQTSELSADASHDQNMSKKPASKAKDPTQPRRKKARRACFACQRAHLTCGE